MPGITNKKNRLMGFRIRLETENGLYLYEFGTHIKKIGITQNVKLNLSVAEILRSKEIILVELQKILDGLDRPEEIDKNDGSESD